MKDLHHKGTTPLVPAAVTGPEAPHSEGSGVAQGSRFWVRSKPGAGRRLWAGLLPEAISVIGTGELRFIPWLNSGKLCFICSFYNLHSVKHI